jgi:hypothetical protein
MTAALHSVAFIVPRVRTRRARRPPAAGQGTRAAPAPNCLIGALDGWLRSAACVAVDRRQDRAHVTHRPAMRRICPGPADGRFSRPSPRNVAMDTSRIAPENVPRACYGNADRIGADRVQRVLTRRHVEVQPT